MRHGVTATQFGSGALAVMQLTLQSYSSSWRALVTGSCEDMCRIWSCVLGGLQGRTLRRWAVDRPRGFRCVARVTFFRAKPPWSNLWMLRLRLCVTHD